MNQLSNTNVMDRDIAMNMIKDSKHALCSMSMALMETSNHQLRDMMTKHFMASVQEHYALADFAIAKGWYMAHNTPQQQLRSHLTQQQQVHS